eukprot:c55424_g1_i1 orf=194-394(+)
MSTLNLTLLALTPQLRLTWSVYATVIRTIAGLLPAEIHLEPYRQQVTYPVFHIASAKGIRRRMPVT